MLDRPTLMHLYVERQLTGSEIAEIAGVKSSTTIYNWLDRYGISRRNRREAQRPVTPSVQTLEWLYLDQELSIDVIARQLNSSESSISKLLDQYDISKRERWEQMAGWNKGKPLPQAQRQRLSEIAKQRIGKRSPRYGVHLSKATCRKIAESLKGRFRGSENPQWKGGNSSKRLKWYSRYEYKEWRASVFARDDYTCQMCGKPSKGDIQAHHIRPWQDYPDLRFDIDNGITLCKQCHYSIKGQEIDVVSQFDSILRANQ